MGGRVVEGSSLDNWRRGNSTVGSNPTPSAIALEQTAFFLISDLDHTKNHKPGGLLSRRAVCSGRQGLTRGSARPPASSGSTGSLAVTEACARWQRRTSSHSRAAFPERPLPRAQL